ncbi:hypothetical protein [Thermaerobacillus caldiproteolyticus]|uniref:hypothetical protein n=1 Tax=Thermaerobacillus caldiproteolyticus TaxID=247480 RepID=UPI00188BA4DD|nr:hypothetical protein [Anoxybacillus caldiproteolyticus]QPA30054.1 hypothetical protein ISX45_10325 [Anoxybacillus caldiproteolyticus]
MEFKKKADLFMYAFMFELEQTLQNNINKLKEINFHADEANVDTELKSFLKQYIKEEFNRIPEEKWGSNLSLVFTDGRINQKESLSYSTFKNLYISEVYLPNELTDNLKEAVRKEGRVFVNPDLLLEIREDDTENITFIPIELKSTKDDKIPGSSVQQVTPNEWVLFVKHTDKSVNITVGQYVNSITQTMQFPDRSPRPQVSFKTLSQHNVKYRKKEGKELIYFIDKESIAKKSKLLKDWQGILVDRWLDVIQNEKIKKNEAWFNNTIRRYTLDFLSMYEKMNDAEKAELKFKMKKAVDLYSQISNGNSEE